MASSDRGIPDSGESDIDPASDRNIPDSDRTEDDLALVNPERRVPDSEESDIDLTRIPEPGPASEAQSPPRSVLSHRFRESPQKQQNENGSDRNRRGSTRESSIAVVVPAPARLWEYEPFHEDATAVDSVLEELEGPGRSLQYKIYFEDGREETVSSFLYGLFESGPDTTLRFTSQSGRGNQYQQP